MRLPGKAGTTIRRPSLMRLPGPECTPERWSLADALAQQPSDRHLIKKHHHEQQEETSTDNRTYSTRHHSGD